MSDCMTPKLSGNEDYIYKRECTEIDTYDSKTMQNILLKCGFEAAGDITILQQMWLEEKTMKVCSVAILAHDLSRYMPKPSLRHIALSTNI